ncbi:MAG: LysM peptidoglycan-binding domain-containing protein [Kyrpidia sp.]|nr:LysM peptidoglycan-binding domain-containing protein [Kyrpidia sp.]
MGISGECGEIPLVRRGRPGALGGFCRGDGQSQWKRRAIAAVGLALLIALGSSGAVLFHAHSSAEAGEDRTVIVQNGDTLWGFAARYAGPDVDVREWIFQLRRMNHLPNGTIYPGMVLRLPGTK